MNVIEPDVYNDFLNEFINRAPLEGPTFIMDAAQVHTYLVKFILDNDMVKSKIQTLAAHNDGRRDFLALQRHYGGIVLIVDVFCV